MTPYLKHGGYVTVGEGQNNLFDIVLTKLSNTFNKTASSSLKMADIEA